MSDDKPKGKQLKKVPPGKVQVYEKPARPPETRRRKLFHKGKKFSFKPKGMKKMNMGGVMKSRGGTFKGVY